MPTGYTYFIEDGDITTGKEFLKLCTRAFGVAIDQKDDPISVPTATKFNVDSYYLDQYRRSYKKLNLARKIDEEGAKRIMRKRYEEHRKSTVAYVKQAIDLRRKYVKVRREILKWIPPTSEHINLKKFALNQIDICMPRIIDIKKAINSLREPLQLDSESVHKFIKQYIEDCEWSTNYDKKKLDTEIECVAERQKWMDAFLKSIEDI